MKNLVFPGLLIVAGSLLIAAALLSNEPYGMFFGIPLIGWGIVERFIPLLKDKKQK